MKALKEWVDQLLKYDSICDGAMGNIPLVEIVGMKRVLIENHRFIALYASTRIDVYVEGGVLCVTGNDLTLSHMSKARIVINGIVEGLTFCKEGQR